MNGSYNRSVYSTGGGVRITVLFGSVLSFFKISIGSCFISLFEDWR